MVAIPCGQAPSALPRGTPRINDHPLFASSVNSCAWQKLCKLKLFQGYQLSNSRVCIVQHLEIPVEDEARMALAGNTTTEFCSGFKENPILVLAL